MIVVVVVVIFLGILSGSCGHNSLRFRPALIFQPYHANILLNIFDHILKDID